ncbi:MAG: hypothetical protein PHR92_16170 [Lachnospiraceae bacterium]|nr:hypothetical protein [Lachnospiraceae bacterium]
MENRDNWCEQLASTGLSTYSESYRKIMTDLVANGVPANYAVLTETAAEAVIKSVARMICDNNQAILAEFAQCR